MKSRVSSTSVSRGIRKTLYALKNDQPLKEKSIDKKFTIKIANTLEERETFFKLAYSVYLAKGYTNENENQWLIKSYDSDPSTIILIVQDHQKNIAGSITILFDTFNDIPANKIYNEELASFKNNGKRLAEISRLVISPDYRNSKEILVLLFNYMAIFTTRLVKIDNLIVEVNPRHKDYYKAILSFEEIGSEKPCPQVKNAPAILLNLSAQKYHEEFSRCQNCTTIDKSNKTLYPFFVKSEQVGLVAQYLSNQVKPMSNEEKIYFGFLESNKSNAFLGVQK